MSEQQPQATERVPFLTERYNVVQRIGSGQFGTVYKIQRRENGELIAVKVLTAAATAEDIARFAREVRVQKGLEHEFILPILETGLDHEPPWFAMELGDRSLEDVLRGEHGEHLLGVFLAIAEAVQYAHEHDVVHRDIKPANVVLVPNPAEGLLVPKLADFGLGRFVTRDTLTLTVTGQGMGTAGYASPEQVNNAKDVDWRTDIYSLGALLYRMLTGLEPLHMAIENVPARYQHIIRRATHYDREKRYQSVQEIMDGLKFLRALDNPDLKSRPTEQIQDIIQQILLSGVRAERISALARIIRDNVADHDMLRTAFPRLPAGVVKELVREHPDSVLPAVRALDATLEEPQDFDYCDVITDFYVRVFHATDSAEVRALILERLFEFGPRHNRWHVGKKFAEMLSKVKDDGTIHAAYEILKSDWAKLSWHRPYLEKVGIPKVLRSVIRDHMDEMRALGLD